MFTFIETKLFTHLIDEYLSDDEFAALQLYMIVNPEVGDLIKGSGGVRKMRWAASGKGKSGGIRVIYYLRQQQGQIWLLTAYAKNVRDTISAAVLRKIKEELDATY
jgi:hypothetical protein